MGEHYCELMRGLADLASMSAVTWEWLERYARENPRPMYPADFIEEAKEVLKFERTGRKSTICD